jgi:DNA-binding CsgD family transcriptional regulator
VVVSRAQMLAEGNEASGSAASVGEASLADRLAKVVADSPLCVCLVDLSGIRCLSSSRRASVLTASLKDAPGSMLPQIRDRVALIREQGLTGVHFTAPLRFSSGTVAAVHFAVQVVPSRGDLALVLCSVGDEKLREQQAPSIMPPSIRSEPVVFGAIDDAYRILRVSSDVSALLGVEPLTIVGTSILDLLDARSVPNLLAATRWVSGSGQAVTMTGVARTRDGEPISVQFVVAPADASSTGEVFFFTLRPATATDLPASAERLQELEERMWRIAMEVQAAEAAVAFGRSADAFDPRVVGELSSRQLEILTRVAAGERVTTIARALFLAPSTVRNHLSAIFAKFGVHSQTELFEILKRPDEQS